METSTGQETVVWCGSCGIPYAPGTPYCSVCHQTLVATIGDEPAVPLASNADDDDEDMAAPAALEPEVVPGASPLFPEPERRQEPPRGALSRRIPRRPRPLTESEIEAKAAAIVALARAEELAGVEHTPRIADDDEDTPDADAEPLAHLDFLPPLREHDRRWLGAGLVCCVVLIIFVALFVRFLAG